MTMRRSLRTVPAFVALMVAPAAHAQSNLSGQGFGFPTGQFSARTHGTGGSIAEMDPLTPVNPATIGIFRTRVLFFQMEPEFRTVTTANGTERTTTARYPVVLGAMPFGSNWVVGISSSTLLDRTATTSFKTTQFLTPTDSVPMQTTFNIDGAMNDVRLGAAWSPRPWLRLGAGVHAITGHNLVRVLQAFTDTVGFSSFAQQRLLGFGGSALSGGVQIVANKFQLAASARMGGGLNLSVEDTVLGSANVPNRFGASFAFTGITNGAIAVRTSRENWSGLDGLGSGALHGVDAWDTSIGADIPGPRFANRILFLRAGARTRTLPFQAGGKTVTENSVSGGLGTTFANGRVMADLAAIRASRSADLNASERAWTVSFGVGIRP
jgi:hypothetical protein